MADANVDLNDDDGIASLADGIGDDIIANDSGSWPTLRVYLRSVLQSRTGNEMQNEHSDIIQQSLLEAHQEHSKGKAPVDPRHYRHWLRKILLCNLTDAIRRSLRLKRNARQEVRLADERLNSPALEQLIADQSTPSSIIVRRERVDLAHAAIKQLPEVNQQIIRMRFLEGRSTSEIAEKIGRTERAVAGLLRRSLLKLKEEGRSATE